MLLRILEYIVVASQMLLQCNLQPFFTLVVKVRPSMKKDNSIIDTLWLY